MNYTFYFLILIISLNMNSIQAEVHSKVHITGQVYKNFNLKRVQIKDQYNQVYEIARNAFPKSVKIQEGQVFSIEVDENHIFYKNK